MTKPHTSACFFSKLKIAMLLMMLFFTQQQLRAQTELWGTVTNGGAHGYGYIYRTNATGDSLEIKYDFDSLTGRFPGGRFISNGNGKLYGLTSGGGQPATGNGGVLYEYDMRTDSLKVLYYFRSTNPELPYESPVAIYGLTESSPGIFHGVVGGNARWVFKFNANTGIMQLAFMVPNFIGGSAATVQFNGINGSFFKAADGFLYGTTYGYSQCPIAFPNAGSVIRINPATNAFTLVYPFSCTSTNGWNPNGDFVEVSGKLYSSNAWGGLYGGGPSSPGNGTLYEYNRVTSTYTKKHDFDGLTGFRPSSGLTLADNGKLYGTTGAGGTTSASYPYGSGVLFELDPATGAFAKKYEFNDIYYVPGSVGILPRGTPLVNASNGKLYGQTGFGIYEYDINTNTVRAASRYPAIEPGYPSLIETCRPPAYRTFTDSVFNLCEGSSFHFDLHNTNATSIVWKHNGIVSPAQTESILHFDAITLADAGTWKCTLTNECGITQPYALHITVNPASPGMVSSVLTPADTTMICPGTSITLSGNNAGVWNTGAVTAGITVTQPGAYQVINTNACGSFYSNIIVIDTIPSPPSITVSVPPTMVCYGAPVVFSGNVPGGTWDNGSTAPSTTMPADSITPHYVTLPHSCGTDTSNLLVIPDYYFYYEDPAPDISAFGPTHFCTGGSVVLNSNRPWDSPYTWTWYRIEPGFPVAYIGPSSMLTVTTPGFYFVVSNSICDGVRYSDTIEVTVDMGVPAIPLVYPLGPTTFCEGGNVVLETNGTGGTWNNGETGMSVTVTNTGTYYYSASNLCGTATSATVTVMVTPAPTLSWTQSPNLFCSSSSPVSLGGQSPTGGIFSGPGVSGGIFDPAVAGAGIHVLTYGYADMGTGCSATVNQTVQVESPMAPPVIYNSLGPVSTGITICEGDSVMILPVPVPFIFGNWNTGESFPILYVKEPGVYNYTSANTCGTVVSNDFTVTVNPLPVISWSALPDSMCVSAVPISLGTPLPSGGTFTGAGTSGSMFDPAAAGTGIHTLTYTYSDPAGCSASAVQQMVIGSDTVSITALGPTSFCVGESVVLQSNTPGNWTTGESGSTITVSTAGVYGVTANTCGTPSSASIGVNVLLPDSVYNAQTLCNGETYTINGHSYATNGLYSDTLQNLLTGCDSIVFTAITINAPNTAVTQNGIELTASIAAAYQWINCDSGLPLAGETAQLFTAPINGNYAVVVSTAGFCSDTSECLLVNTVNILTIEQLNHFSFYPNPANDHLVITAAAPISQIRITDLAGQKIVDTYTSPVDISFLTRGTYFLEVETTKGKQCQRFIKL